MTDEAQATGVPSIDEEEPAVRVLHPDAWTALRDAMTHGAGLVRDGASLEKACEVLGEIAEASSGALHAAAVAATLVCRSAQRRDESRGVHFRADHPERAVAWESRHVTLSGNPPLKRGGAHAGAEDG
jgi:L-aspartate oxidase